MSDERRCIYCTELKALDAFSTEHIIPKFLGGNAECAAAATDAVCKDCNSLFGRFVDAAVAKGYFLNSIEQGAWRGCFDYGQLSGNVYPLTYFGKSTELKVGPREDVEVWLCPDGGTAWHIHTKHPEDFNSLAGGDPVLRRKDDSSRVYSFNASSHPYWILSNLKSVLAHFTEEPIYIGADSDLEDTLPTGRNKGVFNRKDEVALHERDQIFELINQPDLRQHLIQMDVLFDARFLAKMAIAFGFKILGSKYLDLRYTERLRNLLWTRRKNLDLVEHDVRMKTYFAGLQDRSLMPLTSRTALSS